MAKRKKKEKVRVYIRAQLAQSHLTAPHCLLAVLCWVERKLMTGLNAIPWAGLVIQSSAVGEFNHNFIAFPVDKKCRARKNISDRPRRAVISPLPLLKRSRDTLMSTPSEGLLAQQDIPPYMQMLARTRTHSTCKLWFWLSLGWVVSVYCCIPVLSFEMEY